MTLINKEEDGIKLILPMFIMHISIYSHFLHFIERPSNYVVGTLIVLIQRVTTTTTNHIVNGTCINVYIPCIRNRSTLIHGKFVFFIFIFIFWCIQTNGFICRLWLNVSCWAASTILLFIYLSISYPRIIF